MLWLPIGLILWGVAWHAFREWADRPLTEWDEYCSRVDQEIDAQMACRPSGNVERV